MSTGSSSGASLKGPQRTATPTLNLLLQQRPPPSSTSAPDGIASSSVAPSSSSSPSSSPSSVLAAGADNKISTGGGRDVAATSQPATGGGGGGSGSTGRRAGGIKLNQERVLNGMPGYGVSPMAAASSQEHLLPPPPPPSLPPQQQQQPQSLPPPAKQHPSIAALRQATYAAASSSQQQQRSGSPPVGILSVGSPGGLIRQPSVSPPHNVVDANVGGSAAACMPYGHQIYPSGSVPHHHNGAAMYAPIYPGGGAFTSKEHIPPPGTFVNGPPPPPAEAFLNTSGGRFDHRLVYANGPPPPTSVDRPPSAKQQQQQGMADGVEPNAGASKEVTKNGRGTPSSSERQRAKGRAKESHPPTPIPPSPGGASSVHDDVESSLSSPSWPRTPMSPAVHRVQQGAVPAHVTMGPPAPSVAGGSAPSGSSCSNKECGANLVARLLGDPNVLHCSSDEWADRRAFYERLVHFCETYGHPITSQPTVSKQTVDLYKLYTAVKAKGGFEEVTKKKLWRDLCLLFNIGVSNSASGQLKKQYSRFLFPFECVFDLGGVDPQPILASLDSKKKSKSKPAAVNSASQQQQQQQPPQQYADSYMAGGQQEAAYHKSQYEHQTTAQYVSQPGTFSGHQPPPPPPAPPGQYQPRMTAPPTNAGPSTGPPPNEMIARDPFDDRMQAAPPNYYGCAPGQPPPHISFAAPMKPPYGGYPMTQGQQMLQMGPVAERLLYPPPRAFTPRDSTAGGYHPTPPPPPAPPAAPPGMAPHTGQQPPQSHPPPPAPPPHVVPPQPPLGMKPYGAMQQEQFIHPEGAMARTAPEGGTVPMVQAAAGFAQPGSVPQPAGPSSSQVGYPVYSQSSAQQQQQQQQAAPQGPQPPPPPPLSQPPPPAGAQFVHVTPHGQMDAGGQPSSSVVYSPKLQMNTAVSSPPLHMGAPQQWQPQGGPNRPVVVHPPPPPPPVHGVYAPTAREPPARFAKYPVPTQGMPFQGGLKDHASKSVPLQARREKGAGMFPPNSVEAAQVPVKRRKKISAKEIGPIDPWRIVMVFKSGLLFEITWALNVLNVLLYDDTSALYFGLNMMPGFLDALIDVWKQSLLELAHCLHLSLPAHFASAAGHRHRHYRLRNGRHREGCETLQCERNGTLDDHGNSNDTSLNRTGNSRSAADDSGQDSCWTRRPLWQRRRRPVEDTDLQFSSYLWRKWRSGDSRSSSRSSSTVPSNGSSRKGSDDEEDEQKPAPPPPPSRAVRFRSDLDVHFSLPTSCSFEITTDNDRSILERCLSASNALCGLSCIPGNEAKMSQSSKLLGAVATVVSLGLMPDAFKPDAFRTSADDKQNKTTTKGRPVQYNWYFEGLKTLVDDSFVVLCNLSPQLDLDSHDGSSVRQLLDALLSWATCKDSMALDPLTYAALVAPCRYAQEVLCKLSVMETNVDLILATPPWSRVETLLYLLAGQLSMMEEVMMREFAVALMHAFCLASPVACVAAALQTQTIQHLVAFLDQADSNMHQVVQLHGMQALRENPELMGTSVGMLRRAASTLLCMARIPACRHRFARHHIRLLNFTMSSLMDSRVATTVADVLYELQRVGCDADRESRIGALCC